MDESDRRYHVEEVLVIIGLGIKRHHKGRLARRRSSLHQSYRDVLIPSYNLSTNWRAHIDGFREPRLYAVLPSVPWALLSQLT